MQSDTIRRILSSWQATEGGANSTASLLAWIREQNEATQVQVEPCSITDDSFWFYDDYNGEVLNRKRSFFSITGMRRFENEHFVYEQPIIVQPEIGYLGILCKEINGILHFLMQAKIEPGNVNAVQISPTIQATKSNFTRAHGGRMPAYLKYFERKGNRCSVLYDQVQSEQGAKFFKKRNRNIIIEAFGEVEALPQFKWMTLGQIKALMRVDNLVNMDTRTVLSGFPFALYRLSDGDMGAYRAYFSEEAFYRSVLLRQPKDTVTRLCGAMNDFKMYMDIDAQKVPLFQLVDWDVEPEGIVCKHPAGFEVRYYDIEIAGREVMHWMQPLFKATGRATFGLIAKEIEGALAFLVALRSEIGTFDKVEIAPAIQWDTEGPGAAAARADDVQGVFAAHLQSGEGIMLDVVLSEEGGRFYHEQNRNVILKVKGGELETLPEGYFWADFSGLCYLLQANNCLNIQLRNLLSLLPL
ncbi:MAG: NDP-hexose 2,3-dehydratase family protein [Clostridiales Family XIII bacterium]|jgi:oxidase EvaA|nr:NDP-hexose 2,3-dehydratase family protein [Clostridiales Family XIII bacterium]